MEIHNITRAVIVKEDKILLTECTSRDGKKTWSFLPGGHVNYNEGLQDALIRELGEETNCKNPKISGMLGIYEQSFIDDGKPLHEINYLFKVDVDNKIEEGIDSRASHLSFSWADINDLTKVNLLPKQFKILIPSLLKRGIVDNMLVSNMYEGMQKPQNNNQNNSFIKGKDFER